MSFDAVCKAVPFTAVTITSPFWLRSMRSVRHGSLLAIYHQMKQTGRWDCLKLQWKQGDPNPPYVTMRYISTPNRIEDDDS